MSARFWGGILSLNEYGFYLTFSDSAKYADVARNFVLGEIVGD